MKTKRGDIKRFREHLNSLDDGESNHQHGRYHQLKRKYGDYLYAQDREKFMVDMAEWLKTQEPKPLAVVEAMFRDKWTPVYEVADWKAERMWNFTFSEPVNQIRVRYL